MGPAESIRFQSNYSRSVFAVKSHKLIPEPLLPEIQIVANTHCQLPESQARRSRAIEVPLEFGTERVPEKSVANIIILNNVVLRHATRSERIAHGDQRTRGKCCDRQPLHGVVVVEPPIRLHWTVSSRIQHDLRPAGIRVACRRCLGWFRQSSYFWTATDGSVRSPNGEDVAGEAWIGFRDLKRRSNVAFLPMLPFASENRLTKRPAPESFVIRHQKRREQDARLEAVRLVQHGSNGFLVPFVGGGIGRSSD